MMIPIILASTSSRRQQLLTLADIEYTVHAVDIDETVHDNEKPHVYIQRMVNNKADVACKALPNILKVMSAQAGSNVGTDLTDKLMIITADTIGVLPDEVSILVKPKDKTDAFDMWSKMSGNQHYVWTAVQLRVVDADGGVLYREDILEKTAVEFIELTSQLMDAYWKTGEPQDKAGGYAIQGKGAMWVERINGSYTNVVGLPLAQTINAIKKLQQKITVE